MSSDSRKRGIKFFEEGLRYFQDYDFRRAKDSFEAAAQLLPNQPEILDTLGRTLQQLGEWDRALTYHQRALNLFQQTNNEIGIAKARLNIGDVNNRRGELAEAHHQYHQVLTLAAKTKHLEVYAAALLGIGEIQTKQGNYPTALNRLVNFEGNEQLVKYYLNIAITYERMGNPIRAQTYHNLALRLAKEIGDQVSEAAALMGLGTIYWDQNNLIQTLSYYQQADEFIQTVADPDDLSVCLRKLIEVLPPLGVFVQVRIHLAEVLMSREQLGEKYKCALCYLGLGLIEDYRSEFEPAYECFQQAISLFEDLRDWANLAFCLLNCGNILYRWNEREEALKTYQRGCQAAKKGHAPQIEANCIMNAGRIYTNWGDFDHAMEHYHTALTQFQRIGDQKGVRQCQENMHTCSLWAYYS